jgi:predicted short-subunit dehydrogenase-like oxidoreductase (DUF2520 family)
VKHPSIAIVGPGRLGSALAVQLNGAGYRIEELVARPTAKSLARAKILAKKVRGRASSEKTARLDSDLVWFCLPDSQIARTADQFTGKSWKGQLAFHSSGVLSSEALSAIRKRGAKVASVHPLMTFIEGSFPHLKGATFAAEIVRNLKGAPRRIRKQEKAAYHAFATMICPLLVALLANAEESARLAGISSREARRRMPPIINQTLANYQTFGPAKAFTGPIARGDIETVRLHLEALAKSPAARNTYAALALTALDLLPARKRNELKKVVNRFSLRPRR